MNTSSKFFSCVLVVSGMVLSALACEQPAAQQEPVPAGPPIAAPAGNPVIPISYNIGANCIAYRHKDQSTCSDDSYSECQEAIQDSSCGITPVPGYTFQLTGTSCNYDSSEFYPWEDVCQGNLVPNSQNPIVVNIGENCIAYRHASEATCNADDQSECQAAAQANSCGITAVPGYYFKYTNAFCQYDSSKAYPWEDMCQGTYAPVPQPQCQTDVVVEQGDEPDCQSACLFGCNGDCFPNSGYCTGGPDTACYVGGQGGYCDCGTLHCGAPPEK